VATAKGEGTAADPPCCFFHVLDGAIIRSMTLARSDGSAAALTSASSMAGETEAIGLSQEEDSSEQ